MYTFAIYHRAYCVPVNSIVLSIQDILISVYIYTYHMSGGSDSMLRPSGVADFTRFFAGVHAHLNCQHFQTPPSC